MAEFTQQQVAEMIALWVIHEQTRMKTLCKDVLEQRANLLREEDVVYHDDIKKECDNILKNILITEMGRDLALDASALTTIVQDIDIIGYLTS